MCLGNHKWSRSYLFHFQQTILKYGLIGEGHRGPLPHIETLIFNKAGLYVFRKLHRSWSCTKMKLLMRCPGWRSDKLMLIFVPFRKLGVNRSSLSRAARFLTPTYSAFFTSRKSRADWSMMNKSSSVGTRRVSSLYAITSVLSNTKIPHTHKLTLSVWYLVLIGILTIFFIIFLQFFSFILISVLLSRFFLFTFFPSKFLRLFCWFRLKVKRKEIISLVRSWEALVYLEINKESMKQLEQ